MRADVVIGLDCGTSYIKLSVVDCGGAELIQRRVSSPFISGAKAYDETYPAALWRLIFRMLNHAVTLGCENGMQVLSIAISGVSPVLIIFDPADPDRALAMPYWYLPNVDENSVGIDRAIRRISTLRGAGSEIGLSNAVVCDLIGYLNYRLTAYLSVNSITGSELGFAGADRLEKELSHRNVGTNQIQLLPPSQVCGQTRMFRSAKPITVCAGAPDSFAAALSARAVRSGSKMIYLGTFGSLLDVLEDLEPLIDGLVAPKQPYRWRLSVPGFGAAVEGHAEVSFGGGTLSNKLRELDLAASSAPPGARGVFFHMPTWDKIGVEHGSFGFQGWNDVGPIPQTLAARAVLEGIAYAIRTFAGDLIATIEEVGIAGGGARSEIWRQVVADVLGLRLVAPTRAGGAWGAACIAAAALGHYLNVQTANGGAAVTIPDFFARARTQETARRAAIWYKSN